VNATDQVTLQTLAEMAVDGVAVISTRRLAEEIGRSRTTAGTSLTRLTVSGQIEKLRRGSGLQSSRYRLLTVKDNRQESLTGIESSGMGYAGVRDLFRSQDLYGAGRLWEAAPKDRLLSVTEIVGWSITRSRDSARNQLMKLESLWVPLAESRVDPAHSQRHLWKFLEMTAEDERVNVEHLSALGGRSRPRFRADTELQHLWEQDRNLARLGMERYEVVAERDILPHATKDEQAGCLLYREKVNSSGYGTVYPDHWGIGAHRVVWWAERGRVPAGHDLHHECQVRTCVNVEHLTVMTRAEHIRIHQHLGLTLAECA
jgi:hypothetical protein